MTKESIIFIKHILESIGYIEEFTQDVSRSDFLSSVKTQDSVIRRLEIIGEAVKNIPKSLKNKYSDIRWVEIAGMRDKLIHHYFGVDLKVTWDVVKKDLPVLKKQMLKIAADLEIGE